MSKLFKQCKNFFVNCILHLCKHCVRKMLVSQKFTWTYSWLWESYKIYCVSPPTGWICLVQNGDLSVQCSLSLSLNFTEGSIELLMSFTMKEFCIPTSSMDIIPLWFTDLLSYIHIGYLLKRVFWVLVSEGDFVKILNPTVESRADLRNEKEERKLKFF